MNHEKEKIIVILGPTASGKTRLAVELAAKFNGEIVSADSRQVYKGMDIGTGKDLEEFSIFPPSPLAGGLRRTSNFQFSKKIQIPYHLIDVASPKRHFDLARYQKLAFKAIDNILSRGKLPILAGGSGLYLQAVVDNYKLAKAAKNINLRKSLEKLEAQKLFSKLKKISPKMAAKLNQSDKNNKRRLIRYLEILKQSKDFKGRRGGKKYESLIIGVTHSPDTIKRRIAKRLILRLKEQNLIGEVEALHHQGLSWKRLESFGLEYKFISLYLQKEINYEEMLKKLNIASYQFSRRQMTWFKRWEKQGARINWLKDYTMATTLIEEFIKKRN